MAATVTAAASDSPRAPDRRWPWSWIGLAAGVATGLFDFAFMWWLDADMIVAGRDATFLISGGFVLTYGAIGLLVGRLMEARLRARADARTIEGQLRELEAKFNSYLEYVLGGHLAQQYPAYAEKSVCFQIDCAENPRPEDRAFFTSMSNFAAAEEIRMVVRVTQPSAGA